MTFPSINGKAPTPTATYLFDVNCNCPKFTEDESTFVHYMVAKLLFLCKRGFPDIHTPISFLSTRVKEPDGDDLKRLGQEANTLTAPVNLQTIR
jgi:hypothetical protein